MDSITHRVVARFVSASSIPIGKGYFSGTLKVHRYRENIQITDMTNAGRRGKRVQQAMVSLSYSFQGETQEFLDLVTDDLSRFDTYAEAKHYLDGLNTPGVEVSESALRGVDVEPMGTEITLKAKEGVTITSSPWDFSVIDHAPMTHPKTGVPIGHQDTQYWPVKKQDGAIFYAWLKDNLAKAAQMNMAAIRDIWGTIGVRYDSH
jgi:hypothetical protein